MIDKFQYIKHPVIDIGCGFNKEFNFDYVAFDKASVIGNGLKSVATHFGDFHNMSEWPDASFGFVHARHVIEHTKDPAMALKEWTRILQVHHYMYLEWPSWCPKHSTEEQNKFKKWDEILSSGKIEEYVSSGGDMGWVSKTPDGKMFLDVHYSNLTLQELILILPINLNIVEQDLTGSDTKLILKKEY